MSIDISILAPIGGVIALIFSAILFFRVKKQSPGNKKMQELSSAIRKGAMAFLKSEYKVLVVFVLFFLLHHLLKIAIYIGVHHLLLSLEQYSQHLLETLECVRLQWPMQELPKEQKINSVKVFL